MRLYYGLPVAAQAEWFRTAFAAEDTAFSMVDNDLEAAVLAAGLIEALMEDGDIVATLAALSTAMVGQRAPKVRPALLAIADGLLRGTARDARRPASLDGNAIKNPVKSKATDEQSMAEATDLAKLSAVVKKVSNEGSEWTKTLAAQVASVVRPMTAQVVSLQEEVEILWWHIGGHSDT